jgi:hypothetical protein
VNTISAFAMGQASRDNPPRVFDWHAAARLIRDRKPSVASAGLGPDWEYTGVTIFQGGEPVTDEYGGYLMSTWATPEIDLDGEVLDCWVLQSEAPEPWDANTRWPESALAILRGDQP